MFEVAEQNWNFCPKHFDKEPPLIIRTRDGAIHPEYSAVELSFGFPP